MSKATKGKAPRRQRMTPHGALLRGINVGGKNKVRMADLADIFRQAGATDVRTDIQSGNVVFSSTSQAAKQIPARVSKDIRDRFGFDVPVVTRTAQELAKVAAENPYIQSSADPASLHVVFLADKPSPNRAAQLDANRSPGDTFTVIGREIYLHLPNGVARSKLTNSYFDTTLNTVSTARNWRTVLKLMQLTKAAAVTREP